MKIAFLTLGCKVNQYETDKLKEQAIKRGYDIVDFEDIADVYCINSCSVTNLSQRKSRQMIAHARLKNKDAIIAVLGCAVESIKEDVTSLRVIADILIGNNDKERFYEILESKLNNKENNSICISDISIEKTYNEKTLLTKAFDVREAVKIEDGCNNFCSYCIIPYLRGRVRSRKYEEIEKEVQALVNDGVKEIILVGIEVASYGKDLENITLVDIIERLNEIKGLERIRLSSLEPRFLTEENVIRLSKCQKLCNYFHISMQSGSSETLKRMNRKYNKELLIDVANRLREYFKNCYIAADVIVGFPGETEDEFEETKNTISLMGLNQLHVFKYSKRNYTRAAKMGNQVDGNIKKRRSEELIAFSENSKEKFLKKVIGNELKVLFENYHEGFLKGYTTNYIKVKIKGEEELCGTIQDVVATSLENETVIGIIKK
ncbi:MAG: tRNA (N(6)-L-threonylcarbamoyladenosine(37)-C(2))-methylthiotransferase MtaB [Clostridia bacterium]|nr:tRNA (N(6)-L-threonylcarbamoyladenosine(37)-C(2))-methylthiotransferase MtaB [Clostridia bacterium]